MRDDASFIDLLVDFGQELRQADVVIGSGEIPHTALLLQRSTHRTFSTSIGQAEAR